MGAERLFLSLVEKLDLSDIEIAALVHVSIPTARLARLTGEFPGRVQVQFRGFVERNRGARSRADLRLPPRGAAA